MNGPDRFLLPDIQSAPDRRLVAIDRDDVKFIQSIHNYSAYALITRDKRIPE